MHGSSRSVLRNRRFLRKQTSAKRDFIPSASPQVSADCTTLTEENDKANTYPQGHQIHLPQNYTAQLPQQQVIHYDAPVLVKLPRALQCLAAYNKPGLKE